MQRNRTIKIAASAVLAILMADGLLMFFSEHYCEFKWKYDDIKSALLIMVCYFASLDIYRRGIRDWGYTLVWFVLGTVCCYFVVDCLYCSYIYSKHESYIEANKVLNESMGYTAFFMFTTFWALFNFVFFCMIMPSVPRWLHKDDGMLH